MHKSPGWSARGLMAGWMTVLATMAGCTASVQDAGGSADAGSPVVDAAVDGTTADAGPSPFDGGPRDAAPATDATVSDAGSLDAGPLDAGSTYIVPAVTACAPIGAPCDAVAPDPGLYASFRKDYFLPASDYSENIPDPVDGGRFHVATVAAASGDVLDVQLDGQSMNTLLVEPLLEWYHVWPDPVVAGEPIWVAFHSRNPSWDQSPSGTLRVVTTGGDALNGTFPVQQTPLPLTYVTTTSDFSTLLVHAKNTSATSQTVTGLLVNGRDALVRGACVPSPVVAPGESVMWSVPLCTPTYAGAPWTVVVTLQGAPAAVGAGRVLRPHFPVEGWPKGGDCTFPGGDQTNFDSHRDAGFDTLYMYWGGNGSCSYDPVAVVNQLAPALGDFHVLIGDDFLDQSNPESAITDTSAVAGFLTGDESDGEIYVNGVPHASVKAADARQLWSMYPELTVYNGAKTNRNVGSFAGMTDVQGIDFYCAACAPHITVWGTHPPLRGPYDYLRNTRDNHMPLPTWLYSQGLSEVWNQNGLFGLIHVQPDPQEILIQALSVMAAGGKGLMWFQTVLAEASHAPQRWDAIAQANWMFRGVRHLLREGDITGNADAGPETIVELIRGPDALVVPLINLRTSAEPTDIGCAGSLISETSVPHWVLDTQVVDVTLTIPDDFAVDDLFEVTATQVLTPSNPLSVTGRQLTLGGVSLDNTTPVRLFVLAGNPAVRAAVAAELPGP